MGLDQEVLQHVLDYDPATGIWRWRNPLSRSKMKSGDIAGRITTHGRRQIRIASGFYYASRLAWLYMTGEWPKNQIDHINQVRDDDRWENPREANQSQNSYNRAWAEEGGEWRGIRRNGNKYVASIGGEYLGNFATFEIAKIARDKALIEKAGPYQNTAIERKMTMILDNFLAFDATPNNLAQVVATYNSANVIDFGIASGIPSSANGGGARDMGIGDDPALKLLVQVITGFASAGAGTLQVALQGAVDNGSGVPGSYSTWWTSPAFALATLNAGSRLLDMDFPRPPDGIAVPRFVRLNYIIGGATMTAGTVQSFIVLDRMDQMYQSTDNSILGGYPAGINIAN